jgi:hypothetical protein
MLAEMKANQAKADADRKSDRENLKGMIDETNASQKERLAKWEAERKSDVKNLKSMMERMMNTDQTDVKLKELTDTVETAHRE